jgi:hypothetical protein
MVSDDKDGPSASVMAIVLVDEEDGNGVDGRSAKVRSELISWASVTTSSRRSLSFPLSKVDVEGISEGLVSVSAPETIEIGRWRSST